MSSKCAVPFTMTPAPSQAPGLQIAFWITKSLNVTLAAGETVKTRCPSVNPLTAVFWKGGGFELPLMVRAPVISMSPSPEFRVMSAPLARTMMSGPYPEPSQSAFQSALAFVLRTASRSEQNPSSPTTSELVFTVRTAPPARAGAATTREPSAITSTASAILVFGTSPPHRKDLFKEGSTGPRTQSRALLRTDLTNPHNCNRNRRKVQ